MPDEQAKSTVSIDNARVRVTEWRFSPRAETGTHRHELDYVVVPIVTGKLLISDADGENQAQLTLGQPYFRSAGAEHNVINANDYEFAFVEIELK